MNSIRQRIILFLLASLLLINFGSSYYIFHHTSEEIEEIFDAEQAQLARIIASIVANSSISDQVGPLLSQVPTQPRDTASTFTHHYERKIAYQVWDEAGNLLLLSENAPLYPFAANVPGFSQTLYEGNKWHVFALYANEAKKWVFTAQHDEAREELIELITKDQLMMLLFVNLLVIAVVTFGVYFGTRPISWLKRELATRGSDNLTQLTTQPGSELFPIQEGINRLLQQIQQAIEQERSFNADLSHELRTPLAAIKVHAQNIELKEQLSDESQLSLQRMISGIDTMSQTIEQLLMLSRLESEQGHLASESVGLKDLAKEVLMLLPAPILQQNQLELLGDNLFVQGNRALLSNLLRNLIENAAKYSPKGSLIQVQVGTMANQAQIEVLDEGPGMTEQQKLNAIKRRYRVSDSQAYGSGLGLAIVQKIIELHRGELVFVDREQSPGLIARVSLPLSQS